MIITILIKDSRKRDEIHQNLKSLNPQYACILNGKTIIENNINIPRPGIITIMLPDLVTWLRGIPEIKHIAGGQDVIRKSHIILSLQDNGFYKILKHKDGDINHLITFQELVKLIEEKIEALNKIS